jgi:hypothetical protein
MHIEDDHKSRAWVVARKSPVAADQSKKRAESSPGKREPRRLDQETSLDHAGLVRGRSGGGRERLHAQSSEAEERADNAGGIDPTGKGAARGPDAASGADTQREDS